VLLAFVLLVMGCNGAARESTERRTATQPDAGGATVTPTGLTKYEPSSARALLVKGRSQFRACLQILDVSTTEGEAKGKLEEALLRATDDPRWSPEFATPVIDIGCPLPPIALDETVPLLERTICRREVSPYLVYVFVGAPSLFEERYPERALASSFPVPGIRRASQEAISQDSTPCAHGVAEAWYLTPADLGDADLLQHYIFGIFPIAEIGR